MQAKYCIRSVAFFFLLLCVESIPLNGVHLYCDREGEQIELKQYLDFENSACTICYCRNHVIQCNMKKENCLTTPGCSRVDSEGKCPGCLFGNKKEVTHGSDWHEGCHQFQCHTGVLTSSQMQCYTPCNNPQAPLNGSCCPRCPGCRLDGRSIPDGSVAYPTENRCVKCICRNRHLECRKRSCPVLLCRPKDVVPDRDGCCSSCQGHRRVITLPRGKCFLGTQLYHSGENKTHDQCTTCSCHKGFLNCIRQICPVLECPQKYRKSIPGQCCPSCVYPEGSCIVGGKVKQHGKTWDKDKCSSCQCINGQVTCHFIKCANHEITCPIGYRRKILPNECCPKCVSVEPGVCVTYGDPHYSTFDKHLFDFQGECRYELAKDCFGRKFSVRVNNDARKSSFFSWTRSLSIKLNVGGKRYKISLGQKLRTKVDRRRVKLPFKDLGLKITRQGYAIKVESDIGIQILWDGASYVEIHAKSDWRGYTCGMCGNFNGNATDDLTMRNGHTALTNEDMANSWLSGKARSCRRRLRKQRMKEAGESGVGELSIRRTQRLTCVNAVSSSVSRCQVLNHTFFAECHKKVDMESFYSSCLLDMCECVSARKCECDSVLAYSRQCEREGFNMTKWKDITNCGGLECPHGAMYMPCAPACKPTCKNPHPNPSCHMKKCKPRCYCPEFTVLHRGVCIPPERCPKRKKKRNKRT